MKFLNIKHGILVKLLIAPSILAVLFAILLFYSYSMNSRTTDVMQQEIIRASDTIQHVYVAAIKPSLQLVEAISFDPLIDYEPMALNQILLDLKQYKAVQSAFFLDENEKIIADGSPEEVQLIGQTLPEDARLDIGFDKPFNGIVGNRLIYSTPFDDQGDKIGRLQVIFSLEGINEITTTLLETVEFNSKNNQSNSRKMLILGLSFVGLTFLVLVFVTRHITTPLTRAVSFTRLIASGDLSEKLDISRQDEIGELSGNLDDMCLSLKEMIKDLTGDVTALSSSSSSLSTIASAQSTAAEEMSTQSESMAVAAEQTAANVNSAKESAERMSEKMVTIATAYDQVSGKVNSIADAVEEISMFVQDVAELCVQAQTLADDAKQKNEASNTGIVDLNQAVQMIDKVVEVITSITAQTKLLAINAAIEAANAGESGKGFSVVANEVKELARQTEDATVNIVNQIKTMQKKTELTVNTINDANGINRQLADITIKIADNVEGQASAAQVISSSATEAAQGVLGISNNIQELSLNIENEVLQSVKDAALGTKEFADNVQQMNHVIGSAGQDALGVNTASQKLAGLAIRLEKQVANFKVRKKQV